jgi:hypothetical protein
MDHGKMGGMDHHKHMGGGMIWQPHQVTWSLGGKPGMRW